MLVSILVVAAAVVSVGLPEIGLAVLVYQPVIQNTALGPVRVAYILGLCVSAGFVWLAYRERIPIVGQLPWRRAWPLAVVVVFSAYVGIRAFWSPLPLLGIAQAIKGVGVVALGCLAFLCLLRRPERLRRFVLGVLVVGVGLSAIGMIGTAVSGWDHSLARIVGEKQGLYRQAVCIALFTAMALLIWRRKRSGAPNVGEIGLIAVIVLGAWSLLQTGARLPVSCAAVGTIAMVIPALRLSDTRRQAFLAATGLVLGVVVFLVANPSDNKVRRRYRMAVTALHHASPGEIAATARKRSPLSDAGETVLRFIALRPEAESATSPDTTGGDVGREMVADAVNANWTRLLSLFGGHTERKYKIVWAKPGEGIEVDVSLSGRLAFYRAALQVFRVHWLLGSGVGGYWVLTNGCYPHNVLLEIAADLGSVGLLLFAGWVLPTLFTVIGLLRAGPYEGADRGRDWMRVIALIFLVVLVFAQLGSTLEDNRVLFLLLPALTIFAARRSPVVTETETS